MDETTRALRQAVKIAIRAGGMEDDELQQAYFAVYVDSFTNCVSAALKAAGYAIVPDEAQDLERGREVKLT